MTYPMVSEKGRNVNGFSRKGRFFRFEARGLRSRFFVPSPSGGGVGGAAGT